VKIAVIRLRNPFVALVLGLLVVGVQYGAQLHALEHVDKTFRHADQSLSTAPTNEACAICALFAGGTNAVASEHGEKSFVITPAGNSQLAPASIATAAPSWYSSRAPPQLL
jgi:hypothetical protein